MRIFELGLPKTTFEGKTVKAEPANAVIFKNVLLLIDFIAWNLSAKFTKKTNKKCFHQVAENLQNRFRLIGNQFFVPDSCRTGITKPFVFVFLVFGIASLEVIHL